MEVALYSKPAKDLNGGGQQDKDYLEHLRAMFADKLDLPPDVEIVPYGGKDALKNTVLVKFMISRFEKIFITFDLDATDDVRPNLLRLGLKDGVDFCAVGQNKPGRGAIEGLLPERTIATVNGRETDLVMQLSSQESKERRSAKSLLKKKYLEEFKRTQDHSEAELKELTRLCRVIRKAFS